MLDAERNYTVHDQELLAIVDSCKKWRHNILSLSQPLEIITDHKNLEHFVTRKELNQRQIRWMEFLGELPYTITFRKGADNGAADALSRLSEYKFTSTPKIDAIVKNPYSLLELTTLSASNDAEFQTCLKESLLQDDTWKLLVDHFCGKSVTLPPRILQHLDQYEYIDDLLYFDGRAVVGNNKDLRKQIAQQFHDTPSGGHSGRDRTYLAARRDFFWPGMKRFMAHYVRTCEKCRRTKLLRQKPYGLLEPLPIPSKPWESISMDMITDLPESEGHDSIFVVVDRLTKMAVFCPIRKDYTAEDIAEVFMRRVYLDHGLPADIVSDRGSIFLSSFWKTILEGCRITGKHSTAFHPQTDGQTERVNQELEQYLRVYTSAQQDDWASILHWAQFHYNNTVSASTGQSPFYLNYGFHPTTHFLIPPRGRSVPGEERMKVIIDNIEEAKAALTLAQESQAKYYNKHHSRVPFKVGDQVYLSTRNLRSTLLKAKLGPRFVGPYKIIKQIGNNAFKLELPQGSRFHNVFHASLLQPYEKSTIDRPTYKPEPLVEGEEVLYYVDEIMDAKRMQGTVKYHTSWLGYGEEDNTWEPLSSFDKKPNLIRNFYQRFPRRPRPKGLEKFLANAEREEGDDVRV
jgi:hypothetical protein